MKSTNVTKKIVAVVIPCYKVQNQIIGVLNSIGNEVDHIIVVDDCCPDNSADLVEKKFLDERLILIRMEKNSGVGGAVIQGYKKAIEMKVDVIVKLDGDGQMDPGRIADLIDPIVKDKADYTKGNRFFSIDAIHRMPKSRVFGNLGLSFLTKLSSGYWNVFDPTNGYTAISGKLLQELNLSKIDNGYFFESDMLFRLNLLNARVCDISIPAIYENEKSNLKIKRVLLEFPMKHLRNLFKRVIYTYYLRDFSIASIELPLGILVGGFGIFLGIISWLKSFSTGIPTQTGTAVLVAISILAGLQFLLAFFAFDMNNSEKHFISESTKS